MRYGIIYKYDGITYSYMDLVTGEIRTADYVRSYWYNFYMTNKTTFINNRLPDVNSKYTLLKYLGKYKAIAIDTEGKFSIVDTNKVDLDEVSNRILSSKSHNGEVSVRQDKSYIVMPKESNNVHYMVCLIKLFNKQHPVFNVNS